jgi:uncharacterized protein YPO0396
MEATLFDNLLPDERAGFRLHRFEVLNWGTFDNHIWSLSPEGFNALLTGDVGSGKSTLVDAITTLLVPNQRIIYNKAAGAESKERTLYSYVRGEFKNEKDANLESAKPVYLRGLDSYSVLLGYFHNEGLEQGVTLAQVFWLKDLSRNPERFYVIARSPLTITEHFSNFGTDILALKRRLRSTPQVELKDTFTAYGGEFRSLFGIEHEQAMELFYQTISMKSVGNLTDFVRIHMLERGDVAPRLDELRKNFENLNRAHEAVLKAKRQIGFLQPLVEEGKRHEDLLRVVEVLRGCRDSLDSYFANRKILLLDARIEQKKLEAEKASQRIEAAEQKINHLKGQENELRTAIHQNGGGRLEAIAKEIANAAGRREGAKKEREKYDALASALALKSPRDEVAFLRNQKETREIFARVQDELASLAEKKLGSSVDFKALTEQIKALESELASLRQRRSNIPLRNLEIRGALCEALEVPEAEIPFAGELIQVGEKETAWEGAIEKLLHGFGLSLLVPERLYPHAARYVDITQLRGRLIYYRASELSGAARVSASDPRSLARKLRLKPDSPYYGWLEREIAERFDYVCCDTLEDFRRQPFAITRQGQIKQAGKRHEKDDRRPIGDRSQYVLGWSNQAKIRALEGTLSDLKKKAQSLAQTITDVAEREKIEGDRRDNARDLLKFESFTLIHWQVFVRQIQELEREKREIENSSDVLKSLQEKLKEAESLRSEEEHVKEELIGTKSAAQESVKRDTEARIEAETSLAVLPPAIQAEVFPKISEHVERVSAGKPVGLTNADRLQSDVRRDLQDKIDAEAKRIDRLTEKVVRQMEAYRREYPVETKDFDASLAALSEYISALKSLEEADLPRHEDRFKKLLNEGTINSIVLLQNQLDKERKGIEDKILFINQSLKQIEYDSGTYIELVHERSLDKEVRDFQQDLRQCLSHGLEGEPLYNEERFLRVKTILERFNGRENLTELDRRWTEKVTDVRHWFEFSAVERWREDGKQKEYYPGSAGKSGGQKEKLAYTVLASALAYQFGLEWNVTRSRTFRFVVIDEAFGRGSDRSAQYALELFKKLNLQLLIVTPLQKIHVIEDFVRSVHFVHNDDGQCSVLRNLTLDEYHAERARYQIGITSLPAAGPPS